MGLSPTRVSKDCEDDAGQGVANRRGDVGGSADGFGGRGRQRRRRRSRQGIIAITNWPSAATPAALDRLDTVARFRAAHPLSDFGRDTSGAITKIYGKDLQRGATATDTAEAFRRQCAGLLDAKADELIPSGAGSGRQFRAGDVRPGNGPVSIHRDSLPPAAQGLMCFDRRWLFWCGTCRGNRWCR